MLFGYLNMQLINTHTYIYIYVIHTWIYIYIYITRTHITHVLYVFIYIIIYIYIHVGTGNSWAFQLSKENDLWNAWFPVYWRVCRLPFQSLLQPAKQPSAVQRVWATAPVAVFPASNMWKTYRKKQETCLQMIDFRHLCWFTLEYANVENGDSSDKS